MRDRGDQGDACTVRGAEERGEPGATGGVVHGGHVEDRCGRVRAEPVGPTRDVPVKHHVADHHHVGADVGARVARRLALPTGLGVVHPVEVCVHGGAQGVHEDQVHGLHARRRAGRDAYRRVADLRQRVRAWAGECPDLHPEVTPALGGPQHVRAASGRRQQDQDVTGAPVRLDLPREHLVGAVVVDDGGEARGLRAQGDRGVGAALGDEPPDQLGGEVLGLGRAPAVPRGEQPPAGDEPLGQQPAPLLDRRRLVLDPGERVRQLREVLLEPSGAGHPAATCVRTAWRAIVR